METMNVIFRTIIALVLVSCIGVAAEAAVPLTPGQITLETFSTALTESLDLLDQSVNSVAGEFGVADMNITSAESIVTKNKINTPGYAGIVLVNQNRVLPSLNPTYFTGPFDTGILNNAAVKDSVQYLKPRMSKEFEVAGSERMAMIIRPVPVGDGIGAAVLLVVPWAFIDGVTQPLINGTSIQCVVMQPDGTVLYASKPMELTKIPPETFSTEFSTFRDVKNAMMTQKEGTSVYELWRGDRTDPKVREAYWNTITLHNNDWRVMVAEVIQ
ncbi:MAG TPA: hypothetical protein VN372_04320 [Methanospirillum sp.]|nr:hypothetical protein [Methanospirillum sp.]